MPGERKVDWHLDGQEKRKEKRPSPFQHQKVLLAALEQMRVGRETRPPRPDSQASDIRSFVQENSSWVLAFPCSSVGKKICLQRRRPRFDFWIRKIPWRRKWQLTPVFWPGKSHGQRSLVGYSPWGCKRVRHDWPIELNCTETSVEWINEWMNDH